MVKLTCRTARPAVWLWAFRKALPMQALVSSLGADASHAPHYPQKAVNHHSWLSCVTPFPSTNFCTRCSISPICTVWRHNFPRLPPPWPKGSSSSLHSCRRNVEGGRLLIEHRAEQALRSTSRDPASMFFRLPALPHLRLLSTSF